MLPLALRGRILVHRRNAFDTGLEHVMKGCLKQKRKLFRQYGQRALAELRDHANRFEYVREGVLSLGRRWNERDLVEESVLLECRR